MSSKVWYSLTFDENFLSLYEKNFSSSYHSEIGSFSNFDQIFWFFLRLPAVGFGKFIQPTVAKFQRQKISRPLCLCQRRNLPSNLPQSYAFLRSSKRQQIFIRVEPNFRPLPRFAKFPNNRGGRTKNSTPFRPKTRT